MKTIAVVTQDPSYPLGEFLKNNLYTVFAGFAQVNNYYIKDLRPGVTIAEDVVLVMLNSIVLEVKDYVLDPRRIIAIDRTISESEVCKILAIPSGTKVLVVNDTPETTIETIALFYRLGINHLDFVPYKPEKEYPEIKIAITPGESERVPGNISAVIDTGHRCIDISTFIKIISMLVISEQEVGRRLLRYAESIVPLDRGVNQQYKELFRKNTELDAVVNISHEGIMLLNNLGVISVYNKSLEKMLDIPEDISGARAEDVLPELISVFNKEVVRDEFMEYKGRYLIVNKEDIEYFGERAGTCFNFQEVTYIRQLEQNFTRKLRDEGLLARYRFSDIRTSSPRMAKCVELAKEIARSEMTVLITGESGTGKELLAQSIHNASKRSKQPFVAFNCAAVPETLMESELFGYEGGAFTGALKEGKAGLFEQANNGTVFLDEIGDMPVSLQAKLLRVLQERQVMRVGSQRITNVNIRVIAATNLDLRQRISAGLFRADLFYRLNVLPLRVPSLRERQEDIRYLLEYFLKLNKKEKLMFTPEAREVLLHYSWPGNIRELANVAAYVSFMAKEEVTLDDLPYYLCPFEDGFERELSLLQLRCNWEKAWDVLQVVGEFNAADIGAGRKSIQDSLASKGVSLTEGEIRRILTALSEVDLVCPNIGRRGSEITNKGKRFLEWMDRR